MANSRWVQFLALGAAFGIGACDDGSDDGGALSTSGEPPTMTAEGPIPTESGALRNWLEGFGYLQWEAESGVHGSTGPHFGGVRTYVNDELFASLSAGNVTHPQGSAAVKGLDAAKIAMAVARSSGA